MWPEEHLLDFGGRLNRETSLQISWHFYPFVVYGTATSYRYLLDVSTAVP